jgi:hypothetical protein
MTAYITGISTRKPASSGVEVAPLESDDVTSAHAGVGGQVAIGLPARGSLSCAVVAMLRTTSWRSVGFVVVGALPGGGQVLIGAASAATVGVVSLPM